MRFNQLLFQGYNQTDVLGVMLPNCPEYVLAFTGAVGVGMIVTTFNPAYKALEVAKQLQMSKTRAVLTNKQLIPVVQEAIKLSGKIMFAVQLFLAYAKT